MRRFCLDSRIVKPCQVTLSYFRFWADARQKADTYATEAITAHTEGTAPIHVKLRPSLLAVAPGIEKSKRGDHEAALL